MRPDSKKPYVDSPMPSRTAASRCVRPACILHSFRRNIARSIAKPLGRCRTLRQNTPSRERDTRNREEQPERASHDGRNLDRLQRLGLYVTSTMIADDTREHYLPERETVHLGRDGASRMWGAMDATPSGTPLSIARPRSANAPRAIWERAPLAAAFR